MSLGLANDACPLPALDTSADIIANSLRRYELGTSRSVAVRLLGGFILELFRQKPSYQRRFQQEAALVQRDWLVTASGGEQCLICQQVRKELG